MFLTFGVNDCSAVAVGGLGEAGGSGSVGDGGVDDEGCIP